MQVENRGIKTQTHRIIENIEIVLNEEGLELIDVVKLNVYLVEIGLFPEMNIVYEQAFQLHKPARTTISVKGLPLDVLVQMDCIAEYNKKQIFQA